MFGDATAQSRRQTSLCAALKLTEKNKSLEVKGHVPQCRWQRQWMHANKSSVAWSTVKLITEINALKTLNRHSSVQIAPLSSSTEFCSVGQMLSGVARVLESPEVVVEGSLSCLNRAYGYATAAELLSD